MYAKSNNQHGRRTPLSLSAAAGGKHNPQQQQQQQMHSQQQQQQHNQNKGTNGSSGNGAAHHHGKHEKKHDEPTLAELKETLQKETKKQQQQQQQQLNIEKKQQQQQQQQQQQNAVEKKNAEKLDEKKAQNGQNSSKNNGNAKEKPKEIVETVDLTLSHENVTPEKAEKNEKSEKSTKEEREKTKTGGRKGEQQQQPQQQQQSNNEKKEKDSGEKKSEKVTDKKKQTDAGPIEKSNASNGEQQKIVATTPSTPTGTVIAPEKTATPTNSSVATTPTSDKKSATPNKSEKVTLATKKSERVTPTIKKSVTTIVIDDVDMTEDEQPEATPTVAKMDISPKKVAENNPTATSTPGKVLSAIKRITTTTMTTTATASTKAETGSSPDRVESQRSYSQISGRRSIRPLTDYTPSYFQSNAQYRESYRRINTELDVTAMTNTSLNVTVGSEVPNNSSFSFFGRGRKRDRTSPVKSQSAMELQTDVELSPPKRARLDMQGFFSAVASPLTLLRSRFSKASIQSSSTPMKLRSKLDGGAVVGVDGGVDNETEEAEECEVQNVSGISVQEEELHNGESGEEVTAVGEEAKGDGGAADDVQNTSNAKDAELNGEKLEGEQLEKAAPEQATSAGGSTSELMHDAQGKHKRCSIM